MVISEKNVPRVQDAPLKMGDIYAVTGDVGFHLQHVMTAELAAGVTFPMPRMDARNLISDGSIEELLRLKDNGVDPEKLFDVLWESVFEAGQEDACSRAMFYAYQGVGDRIRAQRVRHQYANPSLRNAINDLRRAIDDSGPIAFAINRIPKKEEVFRLLIEEKEPPEAPEAVHLNPISDASDISFAFAPETFGEEATASDVMIEVDKSEVEPEPVAPVETEQVVFEEPEKPKVKRGSRTPWRTPKKVAPKPRAEEWAPDASVAWRRTSFIGEADANRRLFEKIEGRERRDERLGRAPTIDSADMESLRSIGALQLEEWMRIRAIPNIGIAIRDALQKKRLPKELTMAAIQVIALEGASAQGRLKLYDPELEEYTVDQLRRDILECITSLTGKRIGKPVNLADLLVARTLGELLIPKLRKHVEEPDELDEAAGL